MDDKDSQADKAKPPSTVPTAPSLTDSHNQGAQFRHPNDERLVKALEMEIFPRFLQSSNKAERDYLADVYNEVVEVVQSCPNPDPSAPAESVYPRKKATEGSNASTDTVNKTAKDANGKSPSIGGGSG